jgi:hypothetical protein
MFELIAAGCEMRGLIDRGNLFSAMPPVDRLSQGSK